MSVIDRDVGGVDDFRAPRNAFQANVCMRGAFFGSSRKASLLRKAAPELASRERRCLGEVTVEPAFSGGGIGAG